MIRTEEPVIKPIEEIDIRNSINHEQILERNMSRQDLARLLKRIGKALEHQTSLQMVKELKILKKQLKSKFSICLSNQVIQKFIRTTGASIDEGISSFDGIDKEIRQTSLQINKKKHFFDKEAAKRKKENTHDVDRRKKRNILASSINYLRTHSNLDEAFVHEKLLILQDYISEQEMRKTKEMLIKKIKGIEKQKYGSHAQKIKKYTIYDFILQKIFNLIQEDSKNIVIRQRFEKIYKKMKEEMVSIITNQDQVIQLIKSIKMPSVRPTVKNKLQHKVSPKRNFFQLQKDKLDLNYQIQDTIDTAKRSIKEALIKRGRPDYAYELELSLGNRTTPCFISRKRF